MKMKSKILAVAICLIGSAAFASSDRFGNDRSEILRSSFTNTVDISVLIASAPISYDRSGTLILKRVQCFGTTASTITFNDLIFASGASTRTVFIHQPAAPLLLISQQHTSAEFDMSFSSGLMYHKLGLAPCTIHWDYTIPPPHGDDRD